MKALALLLLLLAFFFSLLVGELPFLDLFDAALSQEGSWNALLHERLPLRQEIKYLIREGAKRLIESRPPLREIECVRCASCGSV